MELHSRTKSLVRNASATLLTMVILGAGLSASAPSASAAGANKSESRVASLKPYMPFDERKPKIPKEILSDARLDQKVKVFVKSKNFKQLFAELSEKTGVKLRAAHEIAAERAIIYFHKRPLRDVMTEISGLFGYHWLVKGEPGEYKYELFEDIRHAKRRDQLREEREKVQNELLLEFLKQTVEDALDATALKHLEHANPRAHGSLISPVRKDDARLLWQFGERFLREVQAGGAISCAFEDLPPRLQAAICDRGNKHLRDIEEHYRESGEEPPGFTPYTPGDLASAGVTFRCVRPGLFRLPYLDLEVQTPEGWTGPRPPRALWPCWLRREREVWGVTGRSYAQETIGEEQLPDKPEITVDGLRWLEHHLGLLIGDLLQAIGGQSEMDVVADYYFQPSHLDSVQKEPLAKLVRRLSEEFEYSCQFDGSTVRLRFDKWFVQPLTQEPPAALIERCWKKIKETGRLGIREMMDIASLPDGQMQWPGFRFIPRAGEAAKRRDTLRLWRALGSQLAPLAQSERGLPAFHLNAGQQIQLLHWAKLQKRDIVPGDLAQSAITVKFRELIDDEGGDYYKFALNLPDGSSCPVRISVMQPLGENNRRGLAERRRANLEADVIEVLEK